MSIFATIILFLSWLFYTFTLPSMIKKLSDESNLNSSSNIIQEKIHIKQEIVEKHKSAKTLESKTIIKKEKGEKVVVKKYKSAPIQTLKQKKHNHDNKQKKEVHNKANNNIEYKNIILIKNNELCSNVSKILNKKIKRAFVDFISDSEYKERLNECFKVFNIDTFKEKIYILDRVINIENVFSKNIIEKNTFLNYDKEEIYLYYYTLFIDNTFKWFNIVKDRFKISKKEYYKYKIFKYKFDRLTNNFIKIRNIFLKKYNIKQKINTFKWKTFNQLIYSDGVKCNTYTLTELFTFYNYLLDNIDYLTNKVRKIDNSKINSYNYYKDTFKSIDDYRLKINKKGHFLWWYNKDIKKYLSLIYFHNKKNYWFWVNPDISLYNNHVISFLNINVSKKLSHSGIKIWNYMFFPEAGKYEKISNKHIFLWKEKDVYYDMVVALKN